MSITPEQQKQLEVLVNKLYWYTVDHRNIHIKLVVKSSSVKTSYGKHRLFITPVQSDSKLIRVPPKGFWVELESLIPIQDLTTIGLENLI